jgi:hypothetical protein
MEAMEFVFCFGRYSYITAEDKSFFEAVPSYCILTEDFADNPIVSKLLKNFPAFNKSTIISTYIMLTNI